MDITTRLQRFAYSERDQRTIKRCLFKLSFAHRRQLYEVFAEHKDIEKPFFDIMLASAYAHSEGTPEAGDQLVDTYKSMFNKLSHE